MGKPRVPPPSQKKVYKNPQILIKYQINLVKKLVLLKKSREEGVNKFLEGYMPLTHLDIPLGLPPPVRQLIPVEIDQFQALDRKHQTRSRKYH